MKISCPGCGKTYQVPQALIDAILQQHQPIPAVPALTPRPRWSRVKIAMLVATLLWPVSASVFMLVDWQQTIAESKPADQPGMYWVKVPIHQEMGIYGTPVSTERDLMSPETIAIKSAIKALAWATPCWAIVIAFLFVVWFATKR